jgi:prevent-host-death family protein
MTEVNIHPAKTHFSRLVDLAASGEEIIIAKAGKPVARLVPYREKGAVRRPGVMRGKIRIKKNFDEPLPKELLDSLKIANTHRGKSYLARRRKVRQAIGTKL